MFIERNISQKLRHFEGKLLFISGPRQSGKTFIVENKLKPIFTLNMDVAADRMSFKKFPDFIVDWYQTNIGPFPRQNSMAKRPLVFIDEIHKVKGWRNIIKGTFDKTGHAIDYVTSGSSAFKLRKQDKGDSLAGRAIWLTLFPISFREYVRTLAPHITLSEPWKGKDSLIEAARENIGHKTTLREIWNEYYKYGSFPENLVRKDEIFYEQWLEDYLSSMLDRDLKDLHVSKDVERVYQVFQLLLEGIGSTFSLNSIAETLAVSPNTVKKDIIAINQILWGFEVPVVNIAKAKQIRKEKKFYPMDFCFTRYKESLFEGGRFESAVAAILRRGLYSETSSILNKLQLGYYRDYSQREIDFVIRDKKTIIMAAECKRKAKQGMGHLKYFLKNKPRESILIVEEPGIFQQVGQICIISIELLAPCLE